MSPTKVKGAGLSEAVVGRPACFVVTLRSVCACAGQSVRLSVNGCAHADAYAAHSQASEPAWLACVRARSSVPIDGWIAHHCGGWMAHSAADVQHGLPFVDVVPPDICLAIAARSAPVDIEVEPLARSKGTHVRGTLRVLM